MPRKNHRLAIILPNDLEYTYRLLEGVIEYVQANAWIELVEIRYIQGEPSPLPEGALDFDGAVTHLNVTDIWARRLIDEGIPVINTSGEWWNKGPFTVAFDGRDVVNLVLEHAFGLCRKYFAYVGVSTLESVSLAAQQELMLAQARERGCATFSYEIGRTCGSENQTRLSGELALNLRGFLAGLPMPAVVCCEDDYIARIVCNAAAAAGILVPDDLAVIGVGDYSVARLGHPPITTLPQPGRLVGHRAIELLHHILDGTEEPGNVRVPVPPIIVRESSGGILVTDERLQRIRQWIHDHACEGLTVGQLAEQLPMSQFTFAKLFARSFGRTPGEEIRVVKTEKAKQYLRGTSFSVETISHLCGFEQQGKFSKFFKRQTNMTPSEYRQGEREKKGKK